MKVNISYPIIGSQKCLEFDDENKFRVFYDKRISHEVPGESLGDEFKGYMFRISGGNDKQGFPMKQGVLTAGRVKVLLRTGVSCYRPRRDGERKRRSVRGCIVSSELSVLNLVIIKKGDHDIEGLTDAASAKPRRLGPKRANKIRKLFNLDAEDDVRQAAIRRPIMKDGKKKDVKAPRIQRLVTPERLQHKRQVASDRRLRIEKTRREAADFSELVTKRYKEAREARAKMHAKRRSQSRKVSGKVSEKPAATAAAAKSS